MSSALSRAQELVSLWLGGLGRARVLEAGCGSTSHLVLPTTHQLVGIDISQRQLDNHRGLHEKILGNLETHRWTRGEFDLVVCWDVIEHLNHPTKALNNLFEAVGTGGLLVLAFPNIWSLKGLVTKLTPFWFHAWFYRHIIGDRRPCTELDQFPTPFRMEIAPRQVLASARRAGLEPVQNECYEGPVQTHLRQRSRLARIALNVVGLGSRILSINQLDLTRSDCMLVLRRPGSTGSRADEAFASKPDARRLSILGSRGIPARHGGFETFAERLALHMASRGWSVTVYCQEPTGEIRKETAWRGIRRVHIPQVVNGPAGTVIFDWQAVRHAAAERPLILTLGYNTAVLLAIFRRLGITNLINMDGIEWQRRKWGLVARGWLRFNERISHWFADHLIADNPEIKHHLLKWVPEARISMIPYGAPAVFAGAPDVLARYGLTAGKYALVVARPEPENSILEIVEAFKARPRGMPLIILGTYHPRKLPYHRRVLALAASCPDIRFLGGIYEEDAMQSLRSHAALYIHGHQVGGTNPSLVEALGAGTPCLAHDNAFNRWVAGDAAAYFNSASHCADLLDELLKDVRRREVMGANARTIHRERFQWDTVLSAYETLISTWAGEAAINLTGKRGV